MSVNPLRARQLNTLPYHSGPWIYWMSRDQRVNDNWALLYAAQQAQRQQQPLAVVFCLQPEFLGASRRSYEFMLHNLAQVDTDLRAKHIPFYLLVGEPETVLPPFVTEWHIGAVVTDFSPLRISRQWKTHLAQMLTIPLWEVDAHNIVPAWVTSPQLEPTAIRFKAKLTAQLPSFLENFPPPATWHIPWSWPSPKIKINQLLLQIKAPAIGAPIDWCESGEKAALKALTKFSSAIDSLSPYLHFGQLAAQRVALTTKNGMVLIDQELADNFCLYQSQYDQVTGFPDWAQQTLSQHLTDPRLHLYSREQLEKSKTVDELWNAAQTELVKLGKITLAVEKYWAKKILEWSKSPSEALDQAIYLIDTYSLSGRDPVSYARLAEAIGGVHDRPGSHRPIYGRIRPLNLPKLQQQFDTQSYIEYVNRL